MSIPPRELLHCAESRLVSLICLMYWLWNFKGYVSPIMSHWLIGPHHVVECSTASVLSAAKGKVTFRETGFAMVVYAHVRMFQIP